MTVRGYLSPAELGERLGVDEHRALEMLRRHGPPGIVRTNDGRFLAPETAVEQLRAHLEQP